jgi:hypothetical protein
MRQYQRYVAPELQGRQRVVLTDFDKKHAGDPMGNPLTLSLWLGVLLYAAAGMVGIVLFHDTAPIAGSLTGGYGIVYTTVAASKLDK